MKQRPFIQLLSIFLFLVSSLSLLNSCGSNGGGGGDEEVPPPPVVGPCAVNDDIYPSSGATAGDLIDQQWYLVNTGQKAYSSTAGNPGADINQANTYTTNNFGLGIIVGIVDEGLEIHHEDLAANVVSGGSWDFKCSDNNPTNTYGSDGDHGTSVAGLVAALDNSIGGRGVAPEASLKGFNFLNAQTLQNYTDSIGGSTSSPNSEDVDIFNLSFGYSVMDDYSIDPDIEAAYKSGVEDLRDVSGDKKGAIYVKSAGNGFIDISSEYVGECNRANAVEITCQNGNMDPDARLPYVIVVGATNASGEKSSYSTAGSNLLISAPGGEYGYDEAVRGDLIETAYEPAMITTDQMGCNRGYSNTANDPANLFQDNSNNENPDCRYTSTFNGTSSAAPVLSGAIALILKQNPDLTWRDVRHILITTADVTPDTAEHGKTTIDVTGDSYIAQDTWVTNKADHAFHNWYGFGQLNVDAAIAAATDYSTDLKTFVNTGWISHDGIDSAIPDNNITGATDTIDVTYDYIIETVQIRVSISHEYSGDVGIELASPYETRSVMLNARNGFAWTDDLSNLVLTSNAFYDETADGNWKIKAVDADIGTAGTLTSWSIRIYGHAAPVLLQ